MNLPRLQTLLKNFNHQTTSEEAGEEKILERALAAHSQIGLIYLESPLFRLLDGVATPKEALTNIAGDLLTNEWLRVQQIGKNEYLLLLSADTSACRPESLPSIIETLKEGLRRGVSLSAGRPILDHLVISSGYAVIRNREGATPGELWAEAIRRARLMAKPELGEDTAGLKEELKCLIAERGYRIAFQPIISIHEGEVFGYEALTRLLPGSKFTSPLQLFQFAEAVEMIYPLEKVTREDALRQLGVLGPGQKLFLNINPRIINDPQFTTGQTRQFTERFNMMPENIVFEITEGTAIKDYHTFRRTLDHYRNQGFLIAIDDFGSGYSNLSTIASLQPDFIKLDISLVRGVQQKPALQAMIEALGTFASRTNAQIIAEGIEEKDELLTLSRLGIGMAQGFFLARPDFRPPDISSGAKLILAKLQGKRRKESQVRQEVGEIMEGGVKLDESTLSGAALDLFEKDRLLEGIVVTRGTEPVGLVMREKLYAKLATRYGYALYLNRPLTLIMDPNPLIIGSDSKLNAASQLAMRRSNRNIYDYLVIADRGEYRGIVSVRKLLQAMTQLQLDLARISNPLTSLPGNPAIRSEAESRLAGGVLFALIYGDLDNFKAYNDYYGFVRGDSVLQFTGEVLQKAIDQEGGEESFLGQIGGDDFVIITAPEQVESICRLVITLFDDGISAFYRPEDLERGYIATQDRHNQPRHYPVISISLAVIDSRQHNYTSYLEMAERAADVKKYAKALPGSVFTKDRRQS